MKRLFLVLILQISFFQIFSVKLSSRFKSTINDYKSRNNKNQLKSDNNDSQQIKYDESLGYKVLKTIPRQLSRLYYTQGFKFFDRNTIVESSGLYGESVMHFVDSNTFEVKQEIELPEKYFGEGCAVFTNPIGKKEIHQMTWRERKIFAYDATNLQKIKEFDMPQDMEEGWGLCTLKKKNDKGILEDIFLGTDGSNNLFEIDPNTWKIMSKTPIVDQQGKQINMLNDLEVIKNNIFINIYLQPTIIQLDSNYKFKRAYDFEQLRKEVFDSDVFFQNGFSDDDEYCLNGIAYDQATERIFITGKKWPAVYEIEFSDFNNK